MTRCCARRSRRTTVACSSTPATAYARRSRRRALRWTPRWPHSVRSSCRCGWGCATGEAELRDGDYFGAVLNRAARVMAAGHGGQILLADSTAVLLSGVDLMRSGIRDGCGTSPTPVGVFQVRAPGLAHRISATAGTRYESGQSAVVRRRASSDASPNSMRCKRRSRLIGSVTLTGVGGVGKTRPGAGGRGASWQMNFRTASGFSNWLRLPIPASVPDAVAAVLGHHPAARHELSAKVVAAALEGRIRLLVFDNCEHVLRRRSRPDRGASSRTRRR